MDKIHVIVPCTPSKLLSNMINAAVKDKKHVIINNINDIDNLENKKIIFAIELNNAGFCTHMDNIFSELFKRGYESLKGSSGAVIIHCDSELFTKTYAQSVVLHANMLGCRFIGRPIVEAIGSLLNLKTMQKNINLPLEELCSVLSKDLGDRLLNDSPKLLKNPKILALHSSNFKTSNTLMLWNMVKENLSYDNIKEIQIENGAIKDCIGCSFKACTHYGEQQSCFYGGIMIEEVYPAILESDAIVWICPNYNDNLSANISAAINRLTALYRTTKFDNKTIFGIIVSGNSGSDALAKQLISALNMNKAFRLPPYFSLMAIANDKGAIFDYPNVQYKAKKFAENIAKEIKA